MTPDQFLADYHAHRELFKWAIYIGGAFLVTGILRNAWIVAAALVLVAVLVFK